MTMDDYVAKLNQLVERMTVEQVRQVMRFAQFIYEDQEPEDIRARQNPVERYQEFSQWAQTRGIDLSGMDSWVKDTGGPAVEGNEP